MTDEATQATLPGGTGSGPGPGDSGEAYCAACGKSYPITVDVCPGDGARLTKLADRPDALLGRVFDERYEIRTALGQGGMGTVYRGWQLSVDREVAIKVIHPKLASDRTAVKRFLREARLSSRLSQPNIVNVYDFGQTQDGILYLVMELLRGHTLARELDGMRALPLRRVTAIALQVCDALDSAHAQGIVHRDLKPGNIVILDEPPGRDLIKVLDFGLAKSLAADTTSQVTNTDAIIGTPLYMPPEQIDGKPSDHRADLYSLGCVLYQMVTGRPPFLKDTSNLVLAAHVNDPPPPLAHEVPSLIATTILRLLEKDPQRRIGSAREVRAAFQELAEGGFASDDRSDTAPDVERRSIDIELAMTAPAAGTSAAAVRSAVAASAVTSAAQPAAPGKRGRVAALVIGAALVAGAMRWRWRATCWENWRNMKPATRSVVPSTSCFRPWP
ncbi:MAG: serine/threonine-protein kinase, partial [Polyangiales bacterium]